MKTEKFELAWISLKEPSSYPTLIHPLAQPAFELSNTFEYQCDIKRLAPNLLKLQSFQIPWGIHNRSKDIQVFAGWQVFNMAFASYPANVPVLVFPNITAAQIETEALRYAFHILAKQLHHKRFAKYCFDLANGFAPSNLSAMIEGNLAKTPLANVYQFCRMDRKTVERHLKALANQFSSIIKLSEDEDE